MGRINLPLLFFFSGISGLIYEIVWMRMLIRVFGITLEAVSTVLAVFMGGLALGSIVFGRFADDVRSPLKWYCGVEYGIAATAVTATVLMQRLPEWLGDLLPAGQHGAGFTAAVRLGFSAAVLLVPAALMGATLPLFTRAVTRRLEETSRRVSLLYGLNTLGAVVGVLFAGFAAIGIWGETRTALCAAAVNFLIAARLHVHLHTRPDEEAREEERRREEKAAKKKKGVPGGLSLAAVCALLGFSGFCALAYEVLWSRLLTLLLGNSVYAFSGMLAAYLAGIGLGSLWARKRIDSIKDPLRLFGKLQIGVSLTALLGFCAYILLGLWTMDDKYLHSPLGQGSDLLIMAAHTLVVVFPTTCLLGYLFPVAVRLGITDPRRMGLSLGKLYGANTLGTILGSLAAGFILIPLIGTRYSFVAVCLLSWLIGMAVLVSSKGGEAPGAPRAWTALPLFIIAGLFILPDPFSMIVARRAKARFSGEVVFHREDKAGTVTVHRFENGGGILLINGMIVSGKGELGNAMAHIPLLFQEDPKKEFIIGFGAGNTFRGGVGHGVQVDVAELNPSVLEAFEYFYPDGPEFLKRSGARVLVNDGRNQLLQAHERYDAVIVDGTPPIFGSGAVNLYTREFFKLAYDRLTEDGIFALWVPLPCFESDLGMILRSLGEVFPFTRIWVFESGYGFLVLNSKRDLPFDAALIEKRIQERNVRADMPKLSPELIFYGHRMNPAQVRAYAARFPAVTDDRPYTEFPLFRFLRGEIFHETHDFLLKVAQRGNDKRSAKLVN